MGLRYRGKPSASLPRATILLLLAVASLTEPLLIRSQAIPAPMPAPLPQPPPVPAPLPQAPPPYTVEVINGNPSLRACDRDHGNDRVSPGPFELSRYERELGDTDTKKDPMRLAEVFNRLAFIEASQGREDDALKHYQKALDQIPQLLDEDAAQCVEGNARNGIGVAWERLGQEQKALASFNLALAIEKRARGPDSAANLADTLNRIGVVYSDLGQRKKALELFLRALPLYPADETSGQAITLNNVGWTRSELGDQGGALRDLESANAMQARTSEVVSQAYTLDSIGMVRSRLHQTEQALAAYQLSIKKAVQVEDRFVEAHALWQIGEIDFDQGDVAGAIENHLAALHLATAIANPGLEGDIQGSLMRDYTPRNTGAAIFFGISAVNAYQRIRQGIAGMETGDQVGFAQLKSPVYRELAELLTQSDQLARAEQVLDLLKEQELREVVRGGPPASKLEPLPLTSAQQSATAAISTAEDKAATLVGISLEYGALARKANRTPAEDARRKQLQLQIEADNREVAELMNGLVLAKLQAGVNPDNANQLGFGEKDTESGLQNAMTDLGPRVLGIRLVLGAEHVYALAITAHGRKKYELPVTPADLRNDVRQTWEALTLADDSAQQQLRRLYRVLVEPLEPELLALESTGSGSEASPPVLLWSLDGVLRYIPMAALYDGQHYLLERFNNVLVTPASYSSLSRTPALSGEKPEALAMGLSRSYGGLPPLCGVKPELEAVVHDARVSDSHGPLNGQLLTDDQSTLAALESRLSEDSKPSIVHIASHFVFAPPDGSEPYLLLAGESSADPHGYAWGLSGIENWAVGFYGTKLLTLSACSTAAEGGSAAAEVAPGDGRELESPGMIAQRRGAQAVLGTLWDVSDASTSLLMSDFYARWIEHPQQGKAEALREAQIDLLQGKLQAKASGNSQCGADEPRPGVLPGDYSHPFYWAPFVLMGNYE